MVEEYDVIDAIGKSPDGRVGLMMSEHRDWSDIDRQIADLQKKVQAYFSYVVDGDMVQDNPDYANHPVWFRLACQTPPPISVHVALAQLRNSLAEHQIEFQVAHYDPSDKNTNINNLITIQPA
jgi:hypothetical protein